MYNKELQLIETQERAYLLGLFYADGCVCRTNNSCSIVLHKKDEYLLIRLAELFPFFKLRTSKANVSTLDCTNKQLKIDLISYGVLPQKSSVTRDKMKVPRIPRGLYRHFIRGFFDGDGSVYKQRTANVKIEIGCTSFRLITDIAHILYNNRITVNMRCSYHGTANRTLDFYKIYTSSYKQSKLFADFIYRDSVIHFDRKYDLLNSAGPIIMEKPLCPKCGSNNTLNNGYRKGKHRIRCKDCNKMSTVTTALSISNSTNAEDELLEA